MIQKKICLLGAFAVGKTSLVRRFVSSLFSEKYHTTVGVKIDKRVMHLDGQDISMVIWDLAGEDELIKVRTSYLRGAAGYFLVIDGTRRDTLPTVRNLKTLVDGEVGMLPSVVLVNKSDLLEEWEVADQDLEVFHADGLPVQLTSARTGAGVEQAFETLARSLLTTS